MDMYKEIYEFASSAGAFEGYVFSRENLVSSDLDNWVKNLVEQYGQLPAEIRESIQTSLDRTIGRAIQSLIPVVGEDNDHVRSLKSLVKGELPRSPRDFEMEKEEKAGRYGD